MCMAYAHLFSSSDVCIYVVGNLYIYLSLPIKGWKSIYIVCLYHKVRAVVYQIL